MSRSWLSRLSTLSLILAFCVILLGAYTRLKDAGLGCPDWPGCYGQITAPTNISDIEKANSIYPDAPVDVSKAKTEMTHRYFAESLGALIFVFSLMALWQHQRQAKALPLWLPISLMLLVLFQGLLGMWTVTLQLWPIIVVAHLLGGFCTLGLLWLAFLYLRQPSLPTHPFPASISFLSFSMLVILLMQIFLGGWTSANYAALICPDFPTCQGHWWPNANFKDAFNIFAIMDTPSRTAVHIAHRIGALITFLLGGALIHVLIHLRKTTTDLNVQSILKKYTRLFALLLLIQIGLGISNVVFFLPLPLAVAHNGIAALLFLTLIGLNFTVHTMRRGYHVS